MQVVPASWMPGAMMERIIVHWSAGRHKASALDRKHYHIIIEGDGTLVKGDPSIALNQAPAKKGYAAHTLNCNSGSIGVSMACMWNAKESPFDPGPAPMTKAQWDKMVLVVADLCERYAIPITDKTVLSHAEVQPNLGIRQRGKWDIARLAFDERVKGARACGEKLRREVVAATIGSLTEKVKSTDGYHIVQKGETWWGIARLHDIPIRDLLMLNDAESTEVLVIGRRLLVSRGKASPAPAKPAPSVPLPGKPEPAPAPSHGGFWAALIAFLSKLFKGA